MDIASRKVIAAEGLLRWRHPEQGVIGPDAFLRVPERGSLAIEIGDWTIFKACEHVAAARLSGASQYRVGVNLFEGQIVDGRLKDVLFDALKAFDLEPPSLELEITEKVMLRQDSKIIETLQELRQLGFGIAFDDYGTGYASLSLLKHYPLTTLKIDRSFVKNLCDSSADIAVVRAILLLAKAFNLQVIAEGVEEEKQCAFLAELGCASAQGYLFGRPMPGACLTEILMAS